MFSFAFYIPEEHSNSFFNANAFLKVCILLGDVTAVSDAMYQLEIFVQGHVKVPKKSIRVCLHLLHLGMKFAFPRHTSHNVHGMNPPQMLWNYTAFIFVTENLINEAQENQKLLPLPTTPSNIPQPSASPCNHFFFPEMLLNSKFLQCFTGMTDFSSAFRMRINGAHLKFACDIALCIA